MGTITSAPDTMSPAIHPKGEPERVRGGSVGARGRGWFHTTLLRERGTAARVVVAKPTSTDRRRESPRIVGGAHCGNRDRASALSRKQSAKQNSNRVLRKRSRWSGADRRSLVSAR